MNTTKIFEVLEQETGWIPDVDVQGRRSVHLEGCTLEYFSPDGALLVLSAALGTETLVDLAHCENYARLNAALIKDSPTAVVIDKNAFYLQSVYDSQDLEIRDVSEIFEQFLNDYEYVSSVNATIQQQANVADNLRILL
ncbi:MAG: hypothetical protein IJ228_10690 [Succinivibrio sp.]|nr:hypothetical protein [Succinivibrio sp.]